MLTLTLLALLSASPAEPTLDSLFKGAHPGSKPVVVDVYTTWCKPCQALEREVFPRADVKKALAPYRFQRLNAEGANGPALLERFRVLQYPSLLLLTPDGALIKLLDASSPEALIADLEDHLALARTLGPVTEATLATRPRDAGLLFLLGLEAKKRGDPGAAETAFERAEAAAGPDSALAALAAWEKLRMAGPEVLRPARIQRLFDFCKRYPASRRSPDALGGVAALLGKQPPPSGTKELLMLVTAAAVKHHEVQSVNNLVFAALALGEPATALEIAKQLAPMTSDPNDLDTVAEAYFQNGQQDQAVKLEESLLKRRPSSAALAQNLARFKSGKRGLPPEQVPADVFADRGPAPTAQDDAGLKAIARATAGLREKCRAASPSDAGTTAAKLVFQRGRVKSLDVKAGPHHDALVKCLTLEAAKLPPLAEGSDGSYTIHF